MSNTKFLDLLGLTRYDTKIKTYIGDGLSAKQDTLVSGTNIKTIGGTSILGSGDIPVPTANHLYKHSVSIYKIDDGEYSGGIFTILSTKSTALTYNDIISYVGNESTNNGIIGMAMYDEEGSPYISAGGFATLYYHPDDEVYFINTRIWFVNGNWFKGNEFIFDNTATINDTITQIF